MSNGRSLHDAANALGLYKSTKGNPINVECDIWMQIGTVNPKNIPYNGAHCRFLFRTNTEILEILEDVLDPHFSSEYRFQYAKSDKWDPKQKEVITQ